MMRLPILALLVAACAAFSPASKKLSPTAGLAASVSEDAGTAASPYAKEVGVTQPVSHNHPRKIV